MKAKIVVCKVYFSDLQDYKLRPVLIYKELWQDYLFLPLTTNLTRKGIKISPEDVKGSLIKQSVVVIPKFWVIHKAYIKEIVWELKSEIFEKVVKMVCDELWCI
jgi:mRNA interferase MazF